MISWIQRTFQQHFKWLFLAILLAMIISFVFITNASTGIGRSGARKLAARPFFGIDLSTPEAQRQLGTDANLSIYLRYNPGRDVSPTQLEQYALHRHASLHLAEQLGLPDPTQEQLVAHIRTLRAFAGTDGQFDPKRYADFTDSLKTNPRMSEGDVSRVIAEDARIAAYEALLAGPGYVLPSDVNEILARRDTTWTLAIASIDGSAFAPRIDTADTALRPWFEARAREYETPARVSVAAIVVPAAKFTDSVKLTDAEIRAAYDANPARYPAPAKAEQIKIDAATGQDANADAAFLAVRPQVEADLRKERADKAALETATELSVRVVEQGVKPAELATFVAKHPEATLVEVGSVGADAMPDSLGGLSAASALLPQVQALNDERPYSDPIAVPAGAAVLVWRENIPARPATLDEVREKVLADYQAAEKRRLFNEAGAKLHSAVVADLAAGKAFADSAKAAATAAGVKVEIQTPAPFSLSGQFPQGLDYTAMQALQTLAKGKVSDFLPSGADKGVLVYAIDQQIPAADPQSPAFVEMRDRLAENLSQSNAQTLVGLAVQAELAKTAPAVE